MSRTWLSSICIMVFFAMTSLRARAHESRPLYVEVMETEPLVFSVQWKAPPSVDSRNTPEITMPEGCRADGEGAGSSRGHTRRRTYRCERDPAGRSIRMAYPAFNPSVSALVRIIRVSGEKHSILAPPGQTEVVIPEKESFASVALDYLRLGIGHILGGYDHLLFLVCLLLIAGTGRRILLTITGFTIAHSITIVFLAVEIVRGDPNSLTYRYPIAVSSSFGLLHGFGFAAVLGETGLPQTEVTTALLFFNVGVELGQLMFIGAVIAIYQGAGWARKRATGRDFSIDTLRPFQTPAAYVVGMLAAFWMIQRVASFWA